MAAVPDDVLGPTAERRGRVALIVGAGCSLEDPTSLALSRTYALEVHQKLIHDGVLDEGDCLNPEDLSTVADAVIDRRGTQRPLVERLPRNYFRFARPNDGYLYAAALLRERAVIAVLTLNFDLAMTAALTELSATEVDVVPGPAAMGDLGAATVIYLHRNVDEADPDQWILTTQALQQAWRDNWEEVVAQRAMSSPVIVFAGLGSQAAVLTETITRIRQAITVDTQRVLVVDPEEHTEFGDALDLPDGSHLRIGWCDFMERLANRVGEELRTQLAGACLDLCHQHGWDDELGGIPSLSGRFYRSGLVEAGKIKAAWLVEQQNYAPDDSQRVLIADLLLGVGLIETQLGCSAVFNENGLVHLMDSNQSKITLGVASGKGALRWSALEALLSSKFAALNIPFRPDCILLSGVLGARPEQLAPPADIFLGEGEDDIAHPNTDPTLVTVDEVREGTVDFAG